MTTQAKKPVSMKFCFVSGLIASIAAGVLSMSLYGFVMVLVGTGCPMALHWFNPAVFKFNPASSRRVMLLDGAGALVIILSVYHLRSLGLKGL
jgi:hypothetical protein